MKKLFVVLSVFTVSLLLLNSCSKSDNDETSGNRDGNVNVLTKITDPKFKEYIRNAIDNGRIITASPDFLTEKEAAAVERLDIYHWKIKSLEGIEYFTGLKELDCSNNELQTLDLSKNIKLEKLRCNSCSLNSLNISNSKNLQVLQCWVNKLESLDISNCPKLTTLDCYENSLTKLDISKNKELTSLDINACKIAGTIDVSHCNSLLTLKTSNNPITAIKLNTAIVIFTCVKNDLSELDISRCTELKRIMCTRNPKIASLDISNNRKLINVDCGGISSEPPIILYVWWDVPEDNMWANIPSPLLIDVGHGGKLKTKK